MKKRITSKKSLTNLAHLNTLKDKDIDLSEVPELTPELFAKAVVRLGLKSAPRKSQLTLRLDQDVLVWFKDQGRGYQTRINSLLRAYMEAHRARRGG